MKEISQITQVKKHKMLTLGLIVSGALNIGFMIHSVTSSKENVSPSMIKPLYVQKKQLQTSLDSAFASLKQLSYSSLVTCLTNKELILDGLTKRDLALSCLTSFHHFDLNRALTGSTFQTRVVTLNDSQIVHVFPGLSNSQFDAIIKYAYQEKWPFTTLGLYKILQNSQKPLEDSFYQAFFMTQEFQALQTLFHKTHAIVDSNVLLSLVKEGGFEILEQFFKSQQQLLDLSTDKRRSLLLNYLSAGSKTAANLLINFDADFVLKRLEDQGIILTLSLLTEKNEFAEKFCKNLMQSPRSDAVINAAIEKLTMLTGIAPKNVIRLQDHRQDFETAASLTPVKEEPKILASVPKFKEHVVKDGESLWKISRTYSVKVDDIVKFNDMEKDRLYPGMILRIPDATHQ